MMAAENKLVAAMTTYIPSLTIPSGILLNPAASILLPVALGSAVGFSSRPNNDQKNYMALKQPPCRPPPEIFGPLWTLFYGLMGYGAFRACNSGLSPLRSPDVIQATKHGATLYSIQLGLNLLWMPLFFVAKRPIEATVDILALTGTVGYMTYLWGKVDAVAGWCMVPYFGWLCYASYLSAGVGYLNNWDLSDKTVDSPPSSKPGHTKFVDEKP
ncbi:hypothetical protein O988_00348 [Pseudogymnoascus sp. VKM F-3808]|nr:hypothetical protein O988_00348 [Pseudogymnoascus sp. VKM F-3808]